MSSEYTIKEFRVGDYTDDHGNIWCNVLFVEKANEPMRMVVKDPSAYVVGQVVYGRIEEKTSQAGKPYLRFYREPRPDPAPGATGAPTWTPRDDMAIRAQWAIGQAVELYGLTAEAKKGAWKAQVVEEAARTLFAMVDRVKALAPTEKPAVGSKDVDPADMSDEEFASLMNSALSDTGLDHPWKDGADEEAS